MTFFPPCVQIGQYPATGRLLVDAGALALSKGYYFFASSTDHHLKGVMWVGWHCERDTKKKAAVPLLSDVFVFISNHHLHKGNNYT